MDLSVVIPFYNEEDSLSALHKELIKEFAHLKIKSEIIYVDDGSTDKSLNNLKDSLQNTKVPTKIIEFPRNSGQTAAIAAGIDASRGEYITFLDADLQNDPKDIEKFIEEIKKGKDAVFGWRKRRKDKFLRKLSSSIANWFIRKAFGLKIHDVGCSARVVKREALKKIKLYGELHRILPVLICLQGVNYSEIVVNHRKRQNDKSKYGYGRILKLIIDLITVKFLYSYATKPAYVFGTIGLASYFVGVVTTLVVAYKKFFMGIFVYRQPLFLLSIFFFLVGTELILMGLLAELMTRTYFESQEKPIYEIKNKTSY